MIHLLVTIAKCAVIILSYWASSLIPLGFIKNEATRSLVSRLVPFVVVFVLTAVFAILNRREVKLRVFGKPTRSLATGFIAGLVLALGVVFVLWITNVLTIGASRDLGDRWWTTVFAILAQAAATVAVCYGFVYELIAGRLGSIVAAIFSGILFALTGLIGSGDPTALHVLTLFALGLAFAGIHEYTDSMLASFLSYSVWLLVTGFGLGISNPGAAYPRLITTALSGSAAMTGGSWGVDASAVTLAVALIVFAATFRQKKPD